MKSCGACLLLLALLHVTVKAEDCSMSTITKCITTVVQSLNWLDLGSVGDFEYSQEKINKICSTSKETNKCYYETLEPCSKSTMKALIGEGALSNAKEATSGKGNVQELCDNPKLYEKYGEMSKCYKTHFANVNIECAKKSSKDMGMGEISPDKLKDTTTEDVLKSKCCLLNKQVSCTASSLKDKCGDEIEEFIKKVPKSATVTERFSCGAYKDECAAGINLTAGFSLIFIAIVTIILSK